MRVSSVCNSHTEVLRPVFSASSLLLACLGFFLFSAPPAHAAVSLLLEQPYGKLDLVDPAGHSAIYLDHICAETPLKLRTCRPGEFGVVLSRYDGIGKHDWIAMPLIPYLYAVSSEGQIPQTIDRVSEQQLRDAYRQQFLQAIAPDDASGGAPSGNWYELLGSAFDRTIYGFSVKTSAAQDARFIAIFNDRSNVEHYNGVFRNCADFARVTINLFYPHAVRRNYIADFGLTSPKSVARSLSHYARKHPSIGFEVFVIPQVKGDLPRSHANVDLAEGILKRFGIPLAVVSPVSTAAILAAYVGHGRFAMPRDPPALNLSEVRTTTQIPPISRPFPQVRPLLPPPSLRLAASASTQTRIHPGSSGAQVSLVRVAMVQ